MRNIAKLIRTAPVGKVVGGTLYIHASALNTLPAELRQLVIDAVKIAEEVVDGDTLTLVKIDRSGGMVSFLDYENFDGNPHPPLKRAVTVNMENKRYRESTYYYNRPILHRKETFVSDDYPGRAAFEQLSEDEDAHGLLGRGDIGREDAWEVILAAAGLAIIGHTLVRTA